MYHKEHLLQLQIPYLVKQLGGLQFLQVFEPDDSSRKQFGRLLHADSDTHFVQKPDMRTKFLAKKIVPTIPRITKIDLNFLLN